MRFFQSPSSDYPPRSIDFTFGSTLFTSQPFHSQATKLAQFFIRNDFWEMLRRHLSLSLLAPFLSITTSSILPSLLLLLPYYQSSLLRVISEFTISSCPDMLLAPILWQDKLYYSYIQYVIQGFVWSQNSHIFLFHHLLHAHDILHKSEIIIYIFLSFAVFEPLCLSRLRPKWETLKRWVSFVGRKLHGAADRVSMLQFLIGSS